MKTLDEIFAEEEARLRAEADERDRIDALPENAAKIKAKREAEIKREIEQGLRDKDGEWIIKDDDEPVDEDGEEDDDDDDDKDFVG